MMSDVMTGSAGANASGTGSRGTFFGFLFGGGVLDALPAWAAWLASLLLLAPRLLLARDFFNSGWSRVTNWGSQDYLFTYIHPLPYIPPQLVDDPSPYYLPGAILAPLTTGLELLLPALLVIGLLGRWAGLGCAAMAASIYFLVGGTPIGADFANAAEQMPWIAMGLLLFVLGPGRLSADALIRRRA